MSDSEVHQKTQAEVLRDIFCGIKGREPEDDEELKSWLTSLKGKRRRSSTLPTFLAGAKRDDHSSAQCGLTIHRWLVRA
jgi:hypothetical protein